MSDNRSKRKQRSGTGEDEDEVEIHSNSADDEVKQTTAARPTIVSAPPKRNRSENYREYSQEIFVQKLDGTCTSPQRAGLDVGRASVPVTAAGRTRCVRRRSTERISPRTRSSGTRICWTCRAAVTHCHLRLRGCSLASRVRPAEPDMPPSSLVAT